ncbi:hypothetical protein [Bradyrhizobium sp. CSS354]|uniref:hypothetical protein n=1 Tax=Bradyrhizobium sp. CSS354 TaxID=2699172 RepID=UPI0023B1E378|nr:hypothetical protein [Bradyrhizobium sp. CSS354]MDE5462531.1 hypothetical protein [Bradyrhizobium sp. CSS354]
MNKLTGSVRRLVVPERVQHRALLRKDIANSLCDIAQASLLTLDWLPPPQRRCDDRFCNDNVDEYETTARPTSAPIVLIGGAVRVMSSHYFSVARRHAVDAMSGLDGDN